MSEYMKKTDVYGKIWIWTAAAAGDSGAAPCSAASKSWSSPPSPL